MISSSKSKISELRRQYPPRIIRFCRPKMGFDDFYRQVVRIFVFDDDMMPFPTCFIGKAQKLGALTIEMPKSRILTTISNDGTPGPSPPPGSGIPSRTRSPHFNSVPIIRPAQTAPFVKTGLFPKMFVKALKYDLLEVKQVDFRLFFLSGRSA